jgi:hypothetical protein
MDSYWSAVLNKKNLFLPPGQRNLKFLRLNSNNESLMVGWVNKKIVFMDSYWSAVLNKKKLFLPPGQRNLKFLRLNSNNLTDLDNGAIDFGQSLELLDLAHNRFKSLHYLGGSFLSLCR